MAYLYLNALRDETTVRGIKNTLETLPTGSVAYHETYNNIMTRVNNQSTNRRHLAMQVLSWITQSRRPIRLTELKHALAAAEGTLDLDEKSIPHNRLILGACFGLVTIDQTRNIVQLVHYTTAEYFQKRWGSWFPGAYTHIATACMNYLSFERFSTPACWEWEDYCARLRDNCLYEYAALYWGHHAKQAYPQVRNLVAKLLRSGPKLLNSVHVLDSSSILFPFLGRANGVTSLHVAAYFGIVEQLSELIKEGESHSTSDGHGRTALHWAAKNGQQQAIQILVTQGIDVSELDKQMESALHYSARQGNADAVELLIALGSQVEGRNSYGETPLLVAASSVKTEALQRLLTYGADPNTTDMMGRNALHLTTTAHNGSHAAVKLLVSYGVSIDLCDANNMMPLHYAVAEGKNEIIDWLLEAGANINLGVQRRKRSSSAQLMSTKQSVPAERTREIRDGIGLTPLHFAACSGHSGMTRYLLEKGANPNACCCYGDTPLHIAVRGGLFNAWSKVTSDPYPLVCDDPWTDRSWHVDGVRDTVHDYEPEEADEVNTYIAEERLAVVNALLDSPKIDVNIQNIHFDSPLHLLEYNDHTSAFIFRRMLDRGADIFSCNNKGQTALHFACKAGALPIVMSLLSRGCSISTPDRDGLSALHLAARAGQLATVQSIFSMDEEQARMYCVDVDAEGRTLLHHHLQARFSTVELVDLLLAYGASPSCTDSYGHIPLSTYLGTFKIGSRTAICRFLLQHGGNPYWASPAQLTLAHLAVRQYNAETGVLEALSDYGLDLSIKDASGKGILHHGAIGGSLSLDILNFLHDRNLLDPYDRDVDEKSPLEYASEEAQKERHPDTFHESRWNESLKALHDFIEMKRL